MKHINLFILEKLKIDKDIDIENSKISLDDPTYWKVGDIVCGTWSYSMTIPYFFKILKRTAKSFTIVELPKKLVSGHYNSYHFEEVPDETKKPTKKPQTVRIKRGLNAVYINDRIHLRKWDGKPLVGDDMD